MPKTVVIVGGGFAGVECARRLERLLSADWQIVLFNAENHTTFTPLLAEVVGSSISPLHVVWTIRQTLRRTVCHTAEISRLDFGPQEVEYKLIGGRIARQKYDHLILACGMVVNTDVLPGAAAHSYPLKTMGDALALRNHLIGQLERAEVEPDAERRRHLVSFAVLGGGFSGVEVAGEIFDLLTDALPFYRSLRPTDLHVTIVQGCDRILPELPETLGEYARTRMAARGIEIRLKTRASAVTEWGVRARRGNGDPGRNGCLHDRKYNPSAHRRLRIATGARTDSHGSGHARHRERQRVGDRRLCRRAERLRRKTFSDARAVCHSPGAAAGADISRAALGRPTRPFRYRTLGLFAAIGRRNAVGQVMGFTFDGFFAWFLWRGIYLSKMPTFARKVQIAFDWGWDLLFPRDICELSPRETPRIPRAHFQPGDEIYRQGEPAESSTSSKKGRRACSLAAGRNRSCTSVRANSSGSASWCAPASAAFPSRRTNRSTC